ncbi:MAG TPA: biopolymer transporter ExbD [Myxococcota bacterium]|nr:biopolymer transporter ExbD [Myxococcota bacterium]
MRRLRKPKRPGVATAAAALAPMVDMLTILLVFLLKSWSTDPPVRADDTTFELPTSTSEAPVKSATQIDITDDGIYIEGIRIAGTRYYVEHDDTLIRELNDVLAKKPGPVQVRMDEEAPYVLLRKLLFTAQQAGVEDVTVVAVSRSSL